MSQVDSEVALSDALRGEVQEKWRALAERAPDVAMRVESHPRVLSSLPRVWAASEFVADLCTSQPGMLAHALEQGLLERPPDKGPQSRLRSGGSGDEQDFMRAVRRHRQVRMLAIAWRDLAGWATLEESLAALSDLADECVRAALAFSASALAARHGWPAEDAQGETGELMVLAMGKHGARELNFSSDIDLVFLYPEAGESSGPRPLPHETWFTRQGRMLIRLLDTRTEDGFAFRVDMRLRPFGDSGPLAMSLAAFENYLQQHGRDWERYAYVKARAISGSEAQRSILDDLLRPFVYRRYLDYGIFESLRAMKEKVARVSRQRAGRHDIKLGPGGIREIEFMVQCFQLVRGGAEPALRVRDLRTALSLLGERGHLEAGRAERLDQHYCYLRTLENRLQAMADAQIHSLPVAEPDRARLALAMGQRGWDALEREVSARTRDVHQMFTEIVFGPAREETGRDALLAGVWDGSLSAGAAGDLLTELGFDMPGRVVERLSALRESSLYHRMDEPGRQRLDLLMPMLLSAVARTDPRSEVVSRMVSVVEAVGRRSAYFSLLNENREVRRRLVDLCARSQLLTDEISAHPVLLDELIDPRVFEKPPDIPSLEADLAERFAGIAAGDLEAQMEALRNFQRASVFRVALADLNGVLPLMKVSDLLTGLAQIVLTKVLDLASAQLAARHGLPRDPDGATTPRFGIVGYGKLGGLELGYGSDLDLVFVYSAARGSATDGPRPVDASVFYTRLAQRIVHMLSTQTRSGRLYEVDTRLRPSGKSGMLVSELSAFASYQKSEAWTWEHQALLRARQVAGSVSVAERFAKLRRDVLCVPRETSKLREDIAGMRQRMRAELDRGGEGRFDLKQGAGGLADIEFTVQYLLLANAAARPEVLAWTDNIRQLESLAAAKLLEADTAASLTTIYRAYRQRLHRLSLDDAEGIVAATEFESERRFVSELWEKELGGPGSGATLV